MKEFDIENELKKLPHSPGVYLMHSDTEEILYVGKAVDLHNRVRQYFRKGYGHNNSPKIARMVSQVAYFEYIITGSELEALVLECNLIKRHRPKYNTLMTDDKGYPYIRISSGQDFPTVRMVHRMSRDKSEYFGPYTDRKAVKDTILLLQKLFKIRNCNKDIDKCIRTGERPCLYYQIGQCSAPCAGLISKEDYRKSIDEARHFLNGHPEEIVRRLTSQMTEEAKEMRFEDAAETRDLIQSVRTLMDKQLAASTDSDDRDIIAIARGEHDTVVSIFFIRGGNLIGRDNFHMSAEHDESDSDVVTEFIKQYYSTTPFIPREILTTIEIHDAKLITSYLSDRRHGPCHLLRPERGEKKGLVKLAQENADLVLAQDIERIKRREKRTIGACKEIADKIGIPSASRMEAYDISHISGYNSVASMVVFENGTPRRTSYRKFKLSSDLGNDDYGSMKEVLTRRFTSDTLGPHPDVIMMDGGKGQVNIAEMVLDSLGLDIPVCGMVKDDNHRTRGLYYKNKVVDFPAGSEAMHMVTALQDETHRFAISYHRQLRSKEMVHSVLDDIQGIGPSRKMALLGHFKDADAIKQASLEELASVPGMTVAAAQAVYDFFH